jgi:hypothetical protein
VFASFFGNTNNYHTSREIAIPTGNIYQFIIICLPPENELNPKYWTRAAEKAD